MSRAPWPFSVFNAEGTDSEPRVDFRIDESSDVPILEERSSSPIDFLQDQWLVGTDIENIERYIDCGTISHLFFFTCLSLQHLSRLQTVESVSLCFSQRYERDAKLAQQTQGHNAFAAEKPRCVSHVSM